MNAPAAEPIACYFTRIVVNDPVLIECRAKAKALPFELGELPVGVPLWFAPQRFTLLDVTQGHAGADRVTCNHLSRRFLDLLDRQWSARRTRLSESLDVRMATAPGLQALAAFHQPDAAAASPTEAEMIALCRHAARQRDGLVAKLCDELRSGALAVQGFLAGDMARRTETIPPGWWADDAVVCFWREGELRPDNGAPNGAPHFRGLTVSRGRKAAPAAFAAESFESAPKPPEPRPPFDPREAKALLLARKVSRHWKERPKEEDAREFLKPHFNGIPNGPFRAVWREVWPGEIRRGRRPSTSAAK